MHSPKLPLLLGQMLDMVSGHLYQYIYYHYFHNGNIVFLLHFSLNLAIVWFSLSTPKLLVLLGQRLYIFQVI